jgi:hypothetical protein
MEMKLQRAKSGVYISEAGKVYRLLAVDRAYTKKKAPVYYLQAIEKNKASYISGVFKTKQAGVFSFDLKDDIGVKVYYKLIVSDAGETIEIQKGKA